MTKLHQVHWITHRKSALIIFRSVDSPYYRLVISSHAWFYHICYATRKWKVISLVVVVVL